MKTVQVQADNKERTLKGPYQWEVQPCRKCCLLVQVDAMILTAFKEILLNYIKRKAFSDIKAQETCVLLYKL